MRECFLNPRDKNARRALQGEGSIDPLRSRTRPEVGEGFKSRDSKKELVNIWGHRVWYDSMVNDVNHQFLAVRIRSRELR